MPLCYGQSALSSLSSMPPFRPICTISASAWGCFRKTHLRQIVPSTRWLVKDQQRALMISQRARSIHSQELEGQWECSGTSKADQSVREYRESTRDSREGSHWVWRDARFGQQCAPVAHILQAFFCVFYLSLYYTKKSPIQFSINIIRKLQTLSKSIIYLRVDYIQHLQLTFHPYNDIPQPLVWTFISGSHQHTQTTGLLQIPSRKKMWEELHSYHTRTYEIESFSVSQTEVFFNPSRCEHQILKHRSSIDQTKHALAYPR